MARMIDMWRAGKHADVHPAEEANYASHGWEHGDAKADEADAETDGPEVAVEVETSVVAVAEDDGERVSVYKVIDGVQKDRASRADLTRAEAEAYIAERAEHTFAIVVD